MSSCREQIRCFRTALQSVVQDTSVGAITGGICIISLHERNRIDFPIYDGCHHNKMLTTRTYTHQNIIMYLFYFEFRYVQQRFGLHSTTAFAT